MMKIKSSRTIGKNLNYFKAQASILLKQLSEADMVIHSQLRNRLYQHGFETFLQEPHKIRRKHALQIIAQEQGFDSWSALKHQVEIENSLDFDEFFGRPIFGGFINHWFTRYDEARTLQLQSGGVLLPYKQQFFVTTTTYLEKLGFDHDDKDWQAIGYDWVNPKNVSAKLRIIQNLVARWAT